MGLVMVARLAVLVDGDNVTGTHAAGILSVAREHGAPDVVRVYADAQRASRWHQAIEYRLIHAGTGKNASDLLLTIDAMELALSGGFETFVIASSDNDFTHLAQRLREYGKTVVGVGEAKTPRSFRCACSAFIEIGVGASITTTSEVSPTLTDLDRNIRAMIAVHSKNGKGMKIADLSPEMHKKHGTRISTYPEKTWRNYLVVRPELYDVDPRGPEAMVRFKPAGFSASE